MTRPIVTTIDSLLSILKDYTKFEDIPADAVPLKLFVNPRERHKIALLVESERFKDTNPIEVHFDLRRYYGAS